MRTWHGRLLLALLCAAALCGRYCFPEGAAVASDWLMGRENNRVMQVFAALDDAMRGGPVPVFGERDHGLS